jgi:glycosyltransferase involved in cell wall biosynthesis
MSALVSVLIPCHNAARYLSAALDSVFAQRYSQIEVVVVDDGSTDESCLVAHSYSSRGVRLIRQKKTGAAAARNKAFAASSGTHILYLDADDIIDRSHVEALCSAIAGQPRCVGLSAWDRFTLSSEEANFAHRPGYRDSDPISWLAEDWSHAQPMMQPGIFIVPRSLIEIAGGWDERLSLNDDFEFFTRILTCSDGVRFAPKAKLYYRSGIDGSLSGRKDRKAVESAFLSISLATQRLLTAEDSPRTRRASANVLQNFDYEHYPHYSDLRAKARRKAEELGGADIEPIGPPRFHKLRRFIGWRAARRVQRAMGR